MRLKTSQKNFKDLFAAIKMTPVLLLLNVFDKNIYEDIHNEVKQLPDKKIKEYLAILNKINKDRVHTYLPFRYCPYCSSTRTLLKLDNKSMTYTFTCLNCERKFMVKGLDNEIL